MPKKDQCKYKTSDGQCSRSKCEDSDKFCWQHDRKDSDGPKKKIVKEKKEVLAKKEEKPECRGFVECATAGDYEGYDVYIIPKNTILFHGTSISFPDKQVPRAPAFLAGIKDASLYAFNNNNSGRSPSQGKIITVKTTKDIMVLNMTPKTIALLSTLKDFPKKLFKFAFGYKEGVEQLKRFSYIEEDTELTNWLCSKRFEGWAWNSPSKLHHPELLLCKNGSLARYDEEVRFDGIHTNSYLLMKAGKFLGFVPYNDRDLPPSTDPGVLNPPIGRYGSMFKEVDEDSDSPTTESDKVFMKEIRKAIAEGKIVLRPQNE